MATAKRATDLLLSIGNGDREAFNELFPLVYEELRQIARGRMRLERAGHTLETSGLVHEAYLKLIQLDRVQWQSRAHFLAIAAKAMRNILVSHARGRKRKKRGGGATHLPIEDAEDMPAAEAERILALDLSLDRLAATNERHARVVECRFFGDMTIEETATALGISTATVKRDWNFLRLWVGRELLGPG